MAASVSGGTIPENEEQPDVGTANIGATPSQGAMTALGVAPQLPARLTETDRTGRKVPASTANSS